MERKFENIGVTSRPPPQSFVASQASLEQSMNCPLRSHQGKALQLA
jgi:hypothetical protein